MDLGGRGRRGGRRCGGGCKAGERDEGRGLRGSDVQDAGKGGGGGWRGECSRG